MEKGYRRRHDGHRVHHGRAQPGRERRAPRAGPSPAGRREGPRQRRGPRRVTRAGARAHGLGMSGRVGLVLDASAVLAYTQGKGAVDELLAAVADEDGGTVVAAVALAE